MDHMQPSRGRRAAGVLLALAAATLAAASAIHFGAAVPLGPITITDAFAGAAVPEAIIAAVVAGGAVALLARLGPGRWVALGAALLALLGTAYGLTVTLRRGQPGDIAYHLSLLTVLLAATALLAAPGPRRLSRPSSG